MGRSWITIDGQEVVNMSNVEPGGFVGYELGIALSEYIRLPLEKILESSNPIIRALGMIDRRMGKKKLLRFNVENEDPLVRRLYEFRVNLQERRNIQ
jgi:hypothetical protein